MSTSLTTPGKTIETTIGACLPENNMLRIEVWKSKPSWHALSWSARESILASFARLVQLSLPAGSHEEAGPYLIYERDSALLIWTGDTDRAGGVPQPQGEIHLLDCFEPLVYVTLGQDLTARKLADRLSG